MRISTVLLASAALSLFQAAAQVAVQGKFPPHLAGSFAAQSSLPGSIQRLAPPALALPPLSNADLIQREEEETLAKLRMAAATGSGDETLAYKGAYQFGKALDLQSFAPHNFRSTLGTGRWMAFSDYLRASAVLEEQGYSVFSTKTKQRHQGLLQQQQQQRRRRQFKSQEDETMVWQLEVVSEGALSLNLIFSAFELPAEAEFYVTGRHHVLGAFTGQVNNKADGTFATAPVKGDRLLLQVFMPRRLYEDGVMPRLELSHVIHGYRPVMTAATRAALDDSMGHESLSSSLQQQQQRGKRPLRLVDQSHNNLNDAQQLFARQSDDESTAEEADEVHVTSGKCNLDVACFHEYYDQSRSVGVILTDYNQKYCTGSLINNARNDGRQLFLTAYHCTGFSDTSEHLVMFNYEKTQCGATGEDINEHDTAQGLIKLGAFQESDYTLYEILEPIPDGYNLFLSGWSASPLAPTTRVRGGEEDEALPLQRPKHKKRALYDDLRQEVEDYLARVADAALEQVEEELLVVKKTTKKMMPSPQLGRGGSRRQPNSPPVSNHPGPNPTEVEPIFGIHHPGGDIMKVSFVLNNTLPKACWTDCDPDQYYHWQIPRWDRGTTEPGSSGSPLFNADKRIVGQLHGGTASCYNSKGYDVYGGLHASFRAPPQVKNRLSTYLDPDQTGVQFMDGHGLSAARAAYRMQTSSSEKAAAGHRQQGVEGDRDEFGNFVIRESLAGPGGVDGYARTKPLDGDEELVRAEEDERDVWLDRFFR